MRYNLLLRTRIRRTPNAVHISRTSEKETHAQRERERESERKKEGGMERQTVFGERATMLRLWLCCRRRRTGSGKKTKSLQYCTLYMVRVAIVYGIFFCSTWNELFGSFLFYILMFMSVSVSLSLSLFILVSVHATAFYACRLSRANEPFYLIVLCVCFFVLSSDSQRNVFLY